MHLRDGIRTNGTVRAFRPEPVDDAVVAQVLDDARFAPSGGNQQPWRVVLVKDTAIRHQLGELIRPVWIEYASTQAAGQRAFVLGQSVDFTPIEIPHRIVDDMADAPVVLVVAVDLTRVAMMDGNATHRPAIVGGASIYPFCWNVLLADASGQLAAVEAHADTKPATAPRSARGSSPSAYSTRSTPPAWTNHVLVPKGPTPTGLPGPTHRFGRSSPDTEFVRYLARSKQTPPG